MGRIEVIVKDRYTFEVHQPELNSDLKNQLVGLISLVGQVRLPRKGTAEESEREAVKFAKRELLKVLLHFGYDLGSLKFDRVSDGDFRPLTRVFELTRVLSPFHEDTAITVRKTIRDIVRTHVEQCLEHYEVQARFGYYFYIRYVGGNLAIEQHAEMIEKLCEKFRSELPKGIQSLTIGRVVNQVSVLADSVAYEDRLGCDYRSSIKKALKHIRCLMRFCENCGLLRTPQFYETIENPTTEEMAD